MMKIIVSMNLQMNNRSCYSLFLRCFVFFLAHRRRSIFSSMCFLFLCLRVRDVSSTVAPSSLWTKEQLYCWENVFEEEKYVLFSPSSSSLFFPLLFACRWSSSSSSSASAAAPPPPRIFWLLLFPLFFSPFFPVMDILVGFFFCRRFDWTFFIHI